LTADQTHADQVAKDDTHLQSLGIRPQLNRTLGLWSSDITPDDNPFQAGLGFAVRLNKDPGFIGQEALRVANAAPLDRKLCCLVLDDPLAVALGNEPIRAGDAVVGRVTSGGYGFTVGASIAYGYLPVASAEPGTRLEVEVFGEWIGATVRAEPLFDPEGARIRS
jgi:4-methylaminobutanoate oxidase (formaldehyde-forming)